MFIFILKSLVHFVNTFLEQMHSFDITVLELKWLNQEAAIICCSISHLLPASSARLDPMLAEVSAGDTEKMSQRFPTSVPPPRRLMRDDIAVYSSGPPLGSLPPTL